MILGFHNPEPQESCSRMLLKAPGSFRLQPQPRQRASPLGFRSEAKSVSRPVSILVLFERARDRAARGLRSLCLCCGGFSRSLLGTLLHISVEGNGIRVAENKFGACSRRFLSSSLMT